MEDTYNLDHKGWPRGREGGRRNSQPFFLRHPLIMSSKETFQQWKHIASEDIK